VRRTLLEAVLIAALGAALAFAANGLSPRGLQLTRNYFPGGQPSSSSHAESAPPANGTAGDTNTIAADLAARLKADGLQLADSALALQLFHDPRREQDEIIFIDARDAKHYEAGHIPGAYHFDRFHPEAGLGNVVPVCLNAQRIIFYCNGGDCDDSEHAAIMLRDSLSLPREKVFVYGGGMTDWTAKGLPIESGARNSGQLTSPAAAQPARSNP